MLCNHKQIDQEFVTEMFWIRSVNQKQRHPSLSKPWLVEGNFPYKKYVNAFRWGQVLSNEISKIYGSVVRVFLRTPNKFQFHGSAGQNLCGLFRPKGVNFWIGRRSTWLFFGKGTFRRKTNCLSKSQSRFVPEDNIIIVMLLSNGATSGEAYINGTRWRKTILCAYSGR